MIGGKYLHPKSIGTFLWYWMDDEGQLNTKNLKIYLTDSPTNILSDTELEE